MYNGERVCGLCGGKDWDKESLVFSTESMLMQDLKFLCFVTVKITVVWDVT
jgi:hypothetical protein